MSLIGKERMDGTHTTEKRDFKERNTNPRHISMPGIGIIYIAISGQLSALSRSNG